MSRKKVILYNTTVGAILQNSEQYLKKLRHVLDTFKNRDDMVLWWRPHPLSITTFESMRPQLAIEYKEIVDNYKKEGWGIYDDTPALHRAIAWTDAYYGDQSSVVALYNATEKPVILQDVEIIQDGMPLRFSDFTVDDNGNAWGFESLRDGLFTIDFKTNSAYYVTNSVSNPVNVQQLFNRYMSISCVGDEVICFPYCHNNILIYNNKEKETKEIVLDSNYIVMPEYNGFCIYISIYHQDRIYCFGWNSRAIIVYNIHNSTISYHTKLQECLGTTVYRNGKEYSKCVLYISDKTDDGRVTLIVYNCADLINYNIHTQEIEVIASTNILAHCILAEYDGQYYWLVSDDYEQLIKWNPETNHTTEYDIIKSKATSLNKDGAFTSINDCGRYILLFPGFGDRALKFDKQEEKFLVYNELPALSDPQNIIFKYDKPKRIGNKIFAFSRINHTIYEIGVTSGVISKHKILADKNSQHRFIDDYLFSYFNKESERCLENYLNIDGCDLGYISDYYNRISTKKCKNAQKLDCAPAENLMNKDSTIGSDIYIKIKQFLRCRNPL